MKKVGDFAPWLLFIAIFAFFASQSPRFLEARNLLNILTQASSTGIVAVGMTVALLTAGVDLSVGAIMFVAAAIGGKMALAGMPMAGALAAMLGVGLAFGSFNALVITRLRVAPFIVTLATLFIGRGVGLWITETRAMNLPEQYLALGASRILGISLPMWLFGGTMLAAHLILSRTQFGRQLYAVGYSAEAARKAGVPVRRITATAYLISGFCAAIAAMVTLGQLGAVSPKFGEGKEFAAIAAAALGGTSLFGGRGGVWPGVLLGAVLLQTIDNGLVMMNANPYIYPMVTSSVILVAALLQRAPKTATAPA